MPEIQIPIFRASFGLSRRLDVVYRHLYKCRYHHHVVLCSSIEKLPPTRGNRSLPRCPQKNSAQWYYGITSPIVFNCVSLSCVPFVK